MQMAQAKSLESNQSEASMLKLPRSQLFLCPSDCPNCNERNKHLDVSPRLLINELNGQLKQVPAYSVNQYLSRWSLWHELTSAETERILADKQQQEPELFSTTNTQSPDSLLSSQPSFASSYSLFGIGSAKGVDFNAVVMKAFF